MINEHETKEPKAESKRAVFVRGFLIRFLFGAIPISLAVLIRPDLRSVMALAAAWFFVICMIGASLDVKFRRSVTFDLNRLRVSPKIVVLLILLLTAFVYLFMMGK